MTHLATIGVQIINFLLLFFLLHRFLWKPVRATIEQRKKAFDDDAAAATARATADDERRAARDAEVQALDRARAHVLAEVAVALAADREKVLAEARTSAGVELAAARAALTEEQHAMAKEITEATLDVARVIAEKLLREVSGAAITSAFIDRIWEHLDALPSDEKASLRAEIEVDPTVRIATAHALDDSAEARLRTRLGAYLGGAVRLELVVDRDLVAGAELRFAHARVGSSFRQSLAAAREELERESTTTAPQPKPGPRRHENDSASGGPAHPEIVDA